MVKFLGWCIQSNVVNRRAVPKIAWMDKIGEHIYILIFSTIEDNMATHLVNCIRKALIYKLRQAPSFVHGAQLRLKKES